MERELARAIVNKLGATGTPPEFGIEAFTVGLERYLQVMEDEYLDGILKHGLSSFKLITGNYGGGKTHFLYCVRNLAFRHNYCVAYVTLNPTECPFDKLELVYRAIASNVSPPHPTDRPGEVWSPGIDRIIRRWLETRQAEMDSHERLREYLAKLPGPESASFGNAVRGAFEALAAEDAEGFSEVVQWLRGEETQRDTRVRFRISERVDKATAFRMLRSLIQWIHAIGYSGLLLLFDEAERGMSVTSARDKKRALDNLRQLVDECGNSRLPGAMMLYAVPDENLLFDGSGGVYEALKQRLRSGFSEVNPVGVRINLEELGIEPPEFLARLGNRLAELFETAYEVKLPQERRDRALQLLADIAVSAFVLDVSYRRLFVVAAVDVLHQLRARPDLEFGQKDAEKLLRVTTRQLEKAERTQVESEEF